MFVANGYALFCFKKYSTVNVKGYFGTIISRFSNILKMLRLKKRSTDSLISDFKLFFFLCDTAGSGHLKRKLREL